MIFSKIALLVLIAMTVVGAYYLSHPEKKRYATILVSAIGIITALGIILALKYSRENQYQITSASMVRKAGQQGKQLSAIAGNINSSANQAMSPQTYSYFASLNDLGQETDKAVVADTEISGLLSKAKIKTENGYKMGAGPENEKIYKDIIKQYPDFPFSYMYLAISQLAISDVSWKINAKKALKILKLTTAIEGHSIDHDSAKKMINQMGIKDNDVK
jgi:hypothetical protein